MREKLTSDRTYYVRTDGNDSNNGLTNTSGGAFLTINKAVLVVSNDLDCGPYNVTVQLADGTYNISSAIWLRGVLGTGNYTIQGNTSNSANVVVSSTDHVYLANDQWTKGTVWTLAYHKITSSTAARDLVNCYFSKIAIYNMNFGSCNGGHHLSLFGSSANFSGNWTISGGGASHMALVDSIVNIGGRTCTLTGTPVFTWTLFAVSGTSYLSAFSFTYSGSSTGQRYIAYYNGVINGTGGGASYLPGNTAGTTNNGGIYA
jgi:hypothetical protein